MDNFKSLYFAPKKIFKDKKTISRETQLKLLAITIKNNSIGRR